MFSVYFQHTERNDNNYTIHLYDKKIAFFDMVFHNLLGIQFKGAKRNHEIQMAFRVKKDRLFAAGSLGGRGDHPYHLLIAAI